jgi:hypothetical protein
MICWLDATTKNATILEELYQKLITNFFIIVKTFTLIVSISQRSFVYCS